MATGLLAFFFFFKYRERRPTSRPRSSIPSVRFEIAVIGVPLFFFLLWFVQGFKDYVWYTTPPKNTMDVYVMGKKWMWKFAYAGGGPNAIGTLHVPEGPPGAAADDQPRRHPFVLRARLPHQAGRAARPLHRDLVRSHQAGPLPDALRRVLRDLALADVGRGRGHAGGRVRPVDAGAAAGLAERVDTGGDDGGSFHGSIVEYGKKIAMAEGCVKCHSLDGQPHIGPTWLDIYLRRETLENGQMVVADEGYLTDSMIDPRGEDREGLQAGDAHLQGAAGGAGSGGAGRVHQVTAQRKPRESSLEGSGL